MMHREPGRKRGVSLREGFLRLGMIAAILAVICLWQFAPPGRKAVNIPAAPGAEAGPSAMPSTSAPVQASGNGVSADQAGPAQDVTGRQDSGAGPDVPTSAAAFQPTPEPLPERALIASEWRTETLPAFTAFVEWSDKYLAASESQRSEFERQGIELASARRAAMAALIEDEPRRALAAAVPMAVRQQLPAEIVALLEKRIAGYGDLYRISTFEAQPGQKPYFDYAQIGGDFYFASRYGKRISMFELKSASLQGVAVDNRLAVLDTPVAVAEVGQSIQGRPVNETCFYSGNTTTTAGEGTVTSRESAPIQVGDELVALCVPDHAQFIETALRNLEADSKPSSVDGTLDVATLAGLIKNPPAERPILGYGGAGGTAWPNMPSTNLTYGTKRVVVYRVEMQNWTAFPSGSTYTESSLSNTIINPNPATRTVSNQVFSFSWGKTTITNVVVTPIMVLPKTRDQYTNNYFGPVLQDARVAASALGIDTNVDFHVIVHSGLDAPNLSACAWGGGGAVWVNQCWSLGVLVHEIGHVFGLPHANGWSISDGDVWSPTRTHVEYEDFTDPMGRGHGSVLNHYNAFFKYYMHWYPETLVTNITNSGTYRVFQFDDFNAPLTNKMGMLIRRDAISSYWVSLRGNTATGNFGNAAYVQEVQNNKSDTHVLDFNNPNSDNSNGGLTVGQSYYDSTANLTIKTEAIGGAAPLRWLDFTVSLGETPAVRAWYRFEGDALDSSSNGYHGAVVGGVGFEAGRVHAQAASFNGTDSYATIPYSVSNDFSIALWVKTTATGSPGAWYNGRGLVDATVGVSMSDFGVTLVGNRAAFGVGAPDTTILSVTPINDGKWHHVVAARNSFSGEMRLYVDGVLEATTIGPIGLLSAPTAMRIGGLQSGGGLFTGAIDDVRINNHMLSAPQIAALATMPSAPHAAGNLYVDLRATAATVALNTWSNQASLGHFAKVGTPVLTASVGAAAIPGVSFNGSTDAYQGPTSVSDIDGGSDRSIEVWAYNPSLASEETTVSWGHRSFTRQDMAFNFGNNGTWGAATHWGDDVGWGTAPTANEWHHLVYTYSNNVVRVYVDGALRNSKTLNGALNTFANEVINLACQREANGTRSLLYSGYLNTVRVHGGVLSSQQILANYLYGTWAPGAAPGAAGALTASPRNGQVRLGWSIASGGATGYNVKRSTAGGGPYTTVATVATTNYLDTNVSNGITYYYVVSAGNFFGQSANTPEVSAAVTVSPMPIIAGSLYVDLRATDASAGAATWLNQGTLDDFVEVNNPSLTANVVATGISGVLFNGSSDAYQGPPSVTDIDAGGDRTVEVWAHNPSLASEETTVSWGHRNFTRRDMAFNFGNHGTWGAVTHYGDDVSWGTAPTANEWHHLVYTYSNNVVSVYVDGILRNSKVLGGALNTFPAEVINLACQREDDAARTRTRFFSGYLNTVRIHGGVLTAQQVQSNYFFGPWVANSAPTLAVISDKNVVAGATLLVTNVAGDANANQQLLTFSLMTAPPTATITSNSGVFSWRPTMAQTNTVNPVTVKVADNGVPILSATRSFNVTVLPPVAPILGTASLSNGLFQLMITGDSGPDYTILSSTNLVDWTPIWTTNSAVMPIIFTDPAASNYSQRFYRVQINGP